MGPQALTTSTAIAVAGLTKRFAGTAALSAVDLAVAYGEVHGLLGENGSGKSTLIKVLAGVHAPDAGEVRLGGEPVPTPIPVEVRARYGMAFVHQNLGVVPSLSVAENLLLDEIAVDGGSRLYRQRRRDAQASAILSGLGIELDPRRSLARLGAGDRARIAIARATHSIEALAPPGGRSGAGAGILVLDEATASLTRDDVDQLGTLVRTFAARGGAVLLVSHDLDEVLQLTDRVTVLRDGFRVATEATAGLSRDRLVELIVGRALEPRGAPAAAPDGAASGREALVRVRGLSSELVKGIDLEIGAGEVLGLTGLLGSGADAVPYLLAGASPARAGTLELAGEAVALARLSPFQAMRRGIVLVPANRPVEAAVRNLTVAENIELPYDRPGGAFVTSGALARRSEKKMEAFDVRPRDPAFDMGNLSGGNQQKAILARLFTRDPRLVLLARPTQGVDVGARQQIYERIRSLAPGRAILCVSDDHQELLQLCDRVLVMVEGRLVTELAGGELSPEAIAEATLGAA